MKDFYKEFKTPLVTVFLIFLGFLIYTKIAGPIPFDVTSVTTTKTDLFSASGEGTITAVPDSANVNAGITAQAKTVLEAQDKVNQVADKIIANLNKLGISQKDIKTTNYSVNPEYGQSQEIGMAMMPNIGGGNNITGYSVTENLEIKVNKIENVNKIIDSVTKDGANLVGGASFTFSESTQKNLEEKATKMAVESAKQKAQLLANSAGIRLGKVVNVISSSNGPMPIYATAMMATKDAVGSGERQPTTVTPGQNTVTIGVTIYYQTY